MRNNLMMFAAAVVMLTASAGQATDKVTPVLVTNTAVPVAGTVSLEAGTQVLVAGEVAATQVGTWTTGIDPHANGVRVLNSDNDPLPVRVISTPRPRPFNVYAFPSVETGLRTGPEEIVTTVPEGDTLVLETVSCTAEDDPGQEAMMVVRTQSPGANMQITLQYSGEYIPGVITYNATMPLKMYVAGGDKLKVITFRRHDRVGRKLFGFCSFAGHFE